MRDPGEADWEVAALRDRLSRLSEASLRINESLDFDNVLREVVDGARALIDARYGAITTMDESGRLADFYTSGITAEEWRAVEEAPESLLFYEYLSRLPEPLRVRDFRAHIGARGLPGRFPLAAGAFLAAPIRYRGESIGTLYIARGEEGREFSREDEETLVMFASQAALVISNARRHREEQRARAGLETLIDTSPVGVLVFDALTGAPVSVNREARRIVSGLLEPGGTAEQLLEVATIQRADGSEVALPELSMTQALSVGETVRAEEIVIRVPDGRSVTTLMNATPIFSDDGRVESAVVTLQDLTPLDEMERLRAEFLGMVSHELQAPLASIRGSATTLLNDEPNLDPAEVRQFHRIIEREAGRMRGLISDLLDVARVKTGTLSVAPAPSEVASLVDEARNAFLNAGGRNVLQIEVPQELPWVMADRRRIVQVLGNLLTNAARYSPESSPIRVAAVAEDVHVEISVSDEGRGISDARLPHLFRKFSRFAVDEEEGGAGDTGLGLAICKGIVEAHGGRIWAESDGPGLGSRFTFTIPAVEGEVVGAPVDTAGLAASARRAESEPRRVLVVDDDPLILRYVRSTLARAGYAPIVTGDPQEALRLVKEEKPHLALLDLMLPGTDGIELMKQILDIADVPVIFLSAYGQDEVIVRAFNMGAVDYVVKPFSPTELVARVGAARRKRAAPGHQGPLEPFVAGDLRIDYQDRSVTVDGSPVQLTATEYDLLFELSLHAGRVLTHGQLLQRAWGVIGSGDSRPVRTVVKNLRRKLGDDANDPTYIFSELGVGYRMLAPTTPQEEAP